MAGPVIPGIKLIRRNTSYINDPDDLSFPYKLELSFKFEGLMDFAMQAMFGTEEIMIRGMTPAALEEFLARNSLRAHPHLIRLIITGPDGILESIDRHRPKEDL